MKILVTVLLAAVLIVVVFLAFLSWMSKPPRTGLEHGRLRPCPATPNCVNSEEGTDQEHRIKPLRLKPAGEPGWVLLKEAVALEGGRILEEKPGYLHAVWISRWFRFVDDVELRLDGAGGVLQVRSASRVGHSDLGVNRKRIEALRQRLQLLQEEAGRRSIRRP